MREALFLVTAVWGGSFVTAMIWFVIDEWRHRRAVGPVDRAAVVLPSTLIKAANVTGSAHPESTPDIRVLAHASL